MKSVRHGAVGDAAFTVSEWGERNGRPLFYWHGLNPFAALALNEAGPEWAAHGFRVISIAVPGIADADTIADRAWYRPARLADSVIRIADKLSLDRFAYVGWSWGASIGVYLGARHRNRLDALVLLDAGHTDAPDQGETLDQLIASMAEEHQRYRFPDWDAFIAAVRERNRRWRPELEERFRVGMREGDGAIVPRSDPDAAAAAWFGLLREPPSAAHEELGRTDLPVLLVLATPNDSAGELERFRARVPQTEVREIESGHDLFADAAEETIEIVSDWLRSTVPVHQ